MSDVPQQSKVSGSVWHYMATCVDVKQALAPHGALWLHPGAEFVNCYSMYRRVHNGLASGARCLWVVSHDRVRCLAVYDTIWPPVWMCNRLWQPMAPCRKTSRKIPFKFHYYHYHYSYPQIFKACHTGIYQSKWYQYLS